MSDSLTARRNRRKARRQPARSCARVLCYGNALGLGRNLTVAVLDLSESGIRLRTRAPLEPAQEVQIELEGLGHARPLTLPSRVAWSVAAADGTWCVGLQFPRPLKYSDLINLAKI
jgi:hypothetical protein